MWTVSLARIFECSNDPLSPSVAGAEDVAKRMAVAGLASMPDLSTVPSQQRHKKTWPPAQMPKERVLDGCVQYVHPSGDDADGNGVVFYFNLASDEEDLGRICDLATERFADSIPRPEDEFYYPGQPCVVKFWFDSKWYRGTVIQVADVDGVPMANVRIVDYGTMVRVNVSDIRKDTRGLFDWPILAMELTLPDLKPTDDRDRFSRTQVCEMHNKVVGERVVARLLDWPLQEGASWPLPARITFKVSGCNVVDWLAKLSLARKEVKDDF